MSAALAFHGVAYVVTVAVRRQELQLQVEVDDAASSAAIGAPGAANASAGGDGGACWTASFSAACALRFERFGAGFGGRS